MDDHRFISIVIPVYNEEKNIYLFFDELVSVLSSASYNFEIIFVNDGSKDASGSLLHHLEKTDSRVQVLSFSRNFGKEIALTAGLDHARGDAAIMIDGDRQHPAKLIPAFLEKWREGAEVVVGVRSKNQKESLLKRVGSRIFYQLIRRISETEVTPYATDFRLIDRSVIDAFKRFSERGRMTRALIDWLGFRREYIPFDASERTNGKPTYSFWKLARLAVNSVVALSFFPLKLVGFIGLFIILTSGPLGLYILIGKYFLHTPFASSFSGPAQLAFLVIFMVGLMMCALGLITLYIASIHSEVLKRPLYVLRNNNRRI